MLRPALLMSALILNTAAVAAELCVTAPGGQPPPGPCDMQPGSLAQAVGMAGPGDEILLGPGTFRETLRPRSGAAGKPLHIRGSGRGVTILSGTNIVKVPSGHAAGGALTLAYTPPCAGCGQVFIKGVEVPRLSWPDQPAGRFATVFDHVATGSVQPIDQSTAVIEVRITEPLPDWTFVGGRAAIAQGEEWMELPGRIIGFDRVSGTVRMRVQFEPDKLNPKAGNRIELFPVGAVSSGAPNHPFWSPDAAEQTAFLHLSPLPDAALASLEVKTRAIGIDLSGSSHVVVEALSVFAAEIKTGDTSQDIELRNLRVDYGISRMPTELTSNGWYVEGDREAAIEVRGQGNRLFDTVVEDSMGNGVLVLGHDSVIAGNTILDSDRAGLELAGLSFGPNIGSVGHTVHNNVVLRGGRSLISHRGLKGGTIQGNLVGRWGMLTSDTGGSYTQSGDCAGTVIQDNWFEGSDARYGAGIYLDDYSHGCVVKDNVAIGAATGIWLGTTSYDNTVQDNLAVGTQNGLGIYAPKGQTPNLNGSVVEGNYASPNLQLGPNQDPSNHISTDTSAALRTMALRFAEAHGFPAIAVPTAGPPGH